MPYVTGTAANVTALMNNIRSACTSNGWTLSGNILHKGTAYISNVVTNAYLNSGVNTDYIYWQGGTGKDGSNNLTGAAPTVARTGSFRTNLLTFPCVYEVFIFSDPDEVFVTINYSTDFYQYVMFGTSDVPSLPGTGCYFAASRLIGNGYYADYEFPVNDYNLTSMYSRGDVAQGGPPFFSTASDSSGQNSYIHHNLDGVAWSTNSSPCATAFVPANPLLSLLPSAWNDESVLLPFHIFIVRSSGAKVSLLADLKNLRHCRIDNLDPGQILTLGSDKWKVYPWYRKNAADRDQTSSTYQYSGTLGYAVRYDGA